MLKVWQMLGSRIAWADQEALPTNRARALWCSFNEKAEAAVGLLKGRH